MDQAQDAAQPAPVQGTNVDKAQPMLQERRESEAVSDDELAGVDLDAIEAQAAISTAVSTIEGLSSGSTAMDSEEDKPSMVETAVEIAA